MPTYSCILKGVVISNISVVWQMNQPNHDHNYNSSINLFFSFKWDETSTGSTIIVLFFLKGEKNNINVGEVWKQSLVSPHLLFLNVIANN